MTVAQIMKTANVISPCIELLARLSPIITFASCLKFLLIYANCRKVQRLCRYEYENAGLSSHLKVRHSPRVCCLNVNKVCEFYHACLHSTFLTNLLRHSEMRNLS